MTYGDEPPLLPEGETKGVVQGVSGRQNARVFHGGQPLRAPDLQDPEVGHPAGHVLDGGENATIAHDVQRSLVHEEVPVGRRVVSCGPQWDDLPVVIVEVGMGHAQGAEEESLGLLPEGVPRGPVHDAGKEGVSRVAVPEGGAGEKVQPLLPGQELHHVLFGVGGLIAQSLHLHELQVVPDSAGVVEQVAKSDGLIEGRQLREVVADGIVQGEGTLPGEKHHHGGGELLGHRPGAEDRSGRDGEAEIQVGHAEAPGEGQLPSLQDPHGAAR